MHKQLSIFTAILIFLVSFPLAALGGYTIGFNVGSELHHKGDMGTGIQAGFLLFFALPLAAGACAGGIVMIDKILKDFYDVSKIQRTKKYLIATLAAIALAAVFYTIFNGGNWNY